MGGLLGLLIVFTITYAGGRLGVAATVGTGAALSLKK